VTFSDWILAALWIGLGVCLKGVADELVAWNRDRKAERRLQSRFIRSARWN
jgi:hypothetical protein